ncbi:MAG: zinc-binding dehydrogenase [Brumimicrobium sp.]|nr:zinc-binding dehydrogenase [Brumimicrobium sp.]
MKTTAIKLVKHGDPKEAFSHSEIELEDLQQDEIRIEVESFGLNYADVMARNGLYREAPPLPAVIGYEVVGRVSEIGKEVPLQYLNKRVVAFTRFGGYSKHVNTKYYAAVEIGDYDGGKALCLATQYVTAFFMSHVATTVQQGDHVLIHSAAGGVGTALIQLLRKKGAVLYAKTGSDKKTDYLKDQGVDHIINYNKQDYTAELKRLLGKERLDVSFNPVAGSTFKKDWRLLGNGGTIVLFGGSERSDKKWGILSTLNFVRKMGIIIPITLMMRSKSIIGINMLKIADYKPRTLQYCLEEVVKLALKGDLNPQVGAEYPADKISDAHAFLESGKSTGKIVVHWKD